MNNVSVLLYDNDNDNDGEVGFITCVLGFSMLSALEEESSN